MKKLIILLTIFFLIALKGYSPDPTKKWQLLTKDTTYSGWVYHDIAVKDTFWFGDWTFLTSKNDISALIGDSLLYFVRLSDSTITFITLKQLIDSLATYVTLSQMNDTNNTYGKWDTTGNDIYYNSGNVGIGTNTPSTELEVNGDITLPTGGNYGLRFGTTYPSLVSKQDDDITYYPQQNNKNVTLRISPKGTGYAGYTSSLQMFGTDFVADNINYWGLSLGPDNTKNSVGIRTLSYGTESNKPIRFGTLIPLVDWLTITTDGDVGIGETSPLTYLHINFSTSTTTEASFDGTVWSNTDGTTNNGIKLDFSQSNTDDDLGTSIRTVFTDRTGSSEDALIKLYVLKNGTQKVSSIEDADSINWYIDATKKMWLNELKLNLANSLFVPDTIFLGNDTITQGSSLYVNAKKIYDESDTASILATQYYVNNAIINNCGLSIWIKKSNDFDEVHSTSYITAYSSLPGTTFAWTGPSFSGSNKTEMVINSGEYQLVGTNGACTDTAFVTIYANSIIQDLDGNKTIIHGDTLIFDTDTAVNANNKTSHTDTIKSVGFEVGSNSVMLTESGGLLQVNDTTLPDYIAEYATTVTLGSDNRIPVMNGTTDFDYSPGFTFNGSTLLATAITTGTVSIGGIGALENNDNDDTLLVAVGYDNVEVQVNMSMDGSFTQQIGTISDNDATPNVANGNIWTYNGTANSVIITDLDNPEIGGIYIIIGNSDTYTVTINDAGNFNLSAQWVGGIDDVITIFVQADNDYIEISRSDN